jgi:aconitate hydratase
VEGVAAGISPGMRVTVRVSGEDGEKSFPALARIDTPAEAHYYRHGGILPYVLRRLIGKG